MRCVRQHARCLIRIFNAVTKGLAVAENPAEHVGPLNRRLLTPKEVAALYKVRPVTVSRWANAGKIRSVRTVGGHHRFDPAEIERLLDSRQAPAAEPPAS
jgi:excisionase family DNA binding protein